MAMGRINSLLAENNSLLAEKIPCYRAQNSLRLRHCARQTRAFPMGYHE
jgi:hypothetical protein